MTFLKFLLKTVLNLVVLIFLFLLCILGLTIWIAPKLGPKLIDSWIEGKTGFTTSIQTMDLRPFSGILNIENMTLLNPPYYQNKNFMQIQQFAIQTQLLTLWRRQVVFDSFLINIDRLTLVRTPENSINLFEFAHSFRRPSDHTLQTENSNDSLSNPSPTENPQSRYLIKHFTVQLNSINTVGFTPNEDSQNFTLNYTREFTDVTDIEQVIRSVIMDLASQGVSSLIQDLSLILNSLFTPKIQKNVQKALEQAFPALKNLEMQL